MVQSTHPELGVFFVSDFNRCCVVRSIRAWMWGRYMLISCVAFKSFLVIEEIHLSSGVLSTPPFLEAVYLCHQLILVGSALNFEGVIRLSLLFLVHLLQCIDFWKRCLLERWWRHFSPCPNDWWGHCWGVFNFWLIFNLSSVFLNILFVEERLKLLDRRYFLELLCFWMIIAPSVVVFRLVARGSVVCFHHERFAFHRTLLSLSIELLIWLSASVSVPLPRCWRLFDNKLRISFSILGHCPSHRLIFLNWRA